MGWFRKGLLMHLLRYPGITESKTNTCSLWITAAGFIVDLSQFMWIII